MVIITKHVPFSSQFLAINLFGVILSRRTLDSIELRHELIHTRQQMEMLFIFFYLFYIVEWLVRYIVMRNGIRAYENISFEREAYRRMYEVDYLKRRPFFAWMKYL